MGAPRLLVVTAGMGAGHVTTAEELARRCRLHGAEVQVVDMLADAGPAGSRLRLTYRALLDHAPWLYDGAMRFWTRSPWAMERLTAAGAGPFEHALLDAIERSRPDLVVSCFNLAAQCLGRLRAAGRIGVPLVTVVTDPGAHPYWVSTAVDLHVAYTPRTAAGLQRCGAPAAVWAAPVLRPEFAAPPRRDDARRRLALDGRIAVVNAGSWAVGGLGHTLDLLGDAPGWTVVALCGRDAAALADAGSRRGVRAVPWTENLVDHLAAADVLVDNAGGQTCWEALACAVPVVSFRPLPGHGRLNAVALAALGLVTRVDRDADLIPALGAAGLTTPVVDPFRGPDAAELVLGCLPAKARA